MDSTKKGWALIFSDAHLTNAQLEKDENGLYKLKPLENIKALIDQFNPEYVFNLGDTFHFKDNISATLVYVYKKFIEEIAKKRKVIQLVGNHDFSLTGTDANFTYNPFRLMDIENFTVVNDYYRLDEDNVFISYSRTRELFDSRLKAVGGGKRLFAHLDINGFNLGDDYIEKHAIFDPEEFEAFNEVWTGHYHEPQEKQISEDLKITYIGSPQTVSFGESDQERRVILINLKSGMSRSIPTDMTYHKTIRITVKDELPVFPKEEIEQGVKFRLIITGTEMEYGEYKKKIPKEIKDSIKIIPNYLSQEVTRLEITQNESKEDIIKKYTEKEVNKFFSDLTPEERKKKLELLNELGINYMKKVGS